MRYIGKVINPQNLPEGKVYEVMGASSDFLIVSLEREGQTMEDNARLVWRWPSDELKSGQRFTIKDGKIEVISSAAPTPTESGGL